MKKQKKDEPSQRTLFRKAARELGADESEPSFNAALKTIGRQKPKEREGVQSTVVKSGKQNVQD